jgi:hypothetical protein
LLAQPMSSSSSPSAAGLPKSTRRSRIFKSLRGFGGVTRNPTVSPRPATPDSHASTGTGTGTGAGDSPPAVKQQGGSSLHAQPGSLVAMEPPTGGDERVRIHGEFGAKRENKTDVIPAIELEGRRSSFDSIAPTADTERAGESSCTEKLVKAFAQVTGLDEAEQLRGQLAMVSAERDAARKERDMLRRSGEMLKSQLVEERGKNAHSEPAAALGTTHTRALRQDELSAEKMKFLFQALEIIASDLYLHEVVARVVEMTTKMLSCERVTLFLADPEKKLLIVGACSLRLRVRGLLRGFEGACQRPRCLRRRAVHEASRRRDWVPYPCSVVLPNVRCKGGTCRCLAGY